MPYSKINPQILKLLREISASAEDGENLSPMIYRKIDKIINSDRENFGDIFAERSHSINAVRLVGYYFKRFRKPKKGPDGETEQNPERSGDTKPGIFRVNPFAADMRIDYNIRSGAQLSMTLEEAGLTPRLRKILHKRRIFTLEDLSLRTREEVASFERMTPERAEEAERTLSAYGLTFNRHIEEMSPEELEVLYPGIRYARKEAEERLEFERAIRDAILGSFGDM